MANIFLTPTAEFKPFSYAEMLAPIAAYQEAYDAYDAQLNTLAEDAATKAFNFSAQDTAEKAQYDALMSRLKASADALLTSGLNADIMREIRSINKDYRTSMIPLHQKLAKRAELTAEQRDLQKLNPFLRFSKDYSKSNLQDITASSTYDVIDLSKVEELTSSEFSGITSNMLRRPKYKSILGGQYYEVTDGYGYTPEEMYAGLQNKDSKIYKFYEDTLSKLGISKFDTNTQKEIKQSIISGMMSSAGKFDTQTVSNKNWTTTPKMTDDELQAYLDKVPNNSDFVFDGDLYHKDPNGRVFKIGTQGTGGNGGSNLKSRIGRPQQGVKITFKTKRDNPNEIKKQSTSTFDPKGVDTGNSKIVTYSELPIYAQQEIDNYRGEDVVENYVYMYNEKDNSLYIIPKDINVVENETIDLNAL